MLRETKATVCALLMFLGGVALLPGQSLKAQYRAILNPTITATATAENVSFELHGIKLHLIQGELGWGAPLHGQPTALVFAGRGWLEISLPGRIAQQQVKLFTGSEQLKFIFNAAVFRFANARQLRAAMGAQVHFGVGRSPAGVTRILIARDKVATETARGAPARILDALADTPSPAWAADLLFAQFERADGTWIHVDIDSLEAEPLRVYTIKTRAVPAAALQSSPRPVPERFQSTWTQLAPPGVRSYAPPWKAFGYGLTVRLTPGPDFAASEAVALRSTSGHRGIFLRLDGKYRVLAVDALGEPLDFLQASDPARFGYHAERYAGNWLYLRWPEPLRPRDRVELTLDVERKDAFQVGARVFFTLHSADQAWYPMAPFGGATPRARFHLLFARSPGLRVHLLYSAHWGDDHLSETITGFGWEPGGDPRPVTLTLSPGSKVTLEGMLPAYMRNGDVAHTVLLELEDALRLFNQDFGTLPLRRLALPDYSDWARFSDITGRPSGVPAVVNNLPSSRPVPASTGGLFGRESPSWPGLLPPDGLWMEAVFGSRMTSANKASVAMPSQLDLADIAPAHSLAHQWWGDWVGWTSYQDSWLGEALANGSAVIFAAHEFGDKTAGAIRQDWLRELTHKDVFGHIPNDLGPLCLGPRLASALDPAGYGLVAQDKGGYVIEMLRAMMGETRFAAAMHALTRDYGGRNISVAEFEQLMAAHMSPAMDLDHDGSLRWFFDEYVQHRTIPTLNVSWKTHGQTTDVTIINPQGWRGLLPVYLFRDATQAQRALVPVTAATTHAVLSSPFTPVRIAADPWHEMLIQTEQPKKP